MAVFTKEQGKSGAEKEVMTTCNMHCGGQCILKLHVRDGKVVRIETDDGEEPQYRACAKGRSLRQVVYAPDRLKWPMKRVGERGSGEFERISWDEALDRVASELKRVKETYGPASILAFQSAADTGWLIQEVSAAFFRVLNRFGGYTETWSNISFEAANWASLVTYGCLPSFNSRDDLVNSRLIIMWGWNPASTKNESNSDWYLLKAKEAGSRIIAVDPKYSDSAVTLAHQWIPIRPGTDAAMLIAMAYVMIVENLHDRKFLDAYTVGFDRFQDYVLGVEDGVARTPAWAEPITGVPAATIEKLAREYATAKPAALIAGVGPGRAALGEQYHRAAIVLSAMTGNIGISGGDPGARGHLGSSTAVNTNPYQGRGIFARVPNPVDGMAPPRLESLPGTSGVSSARVHKSMVADAILRGKSGGYFADYKLLYVFKPNLVNQLPNTNKMVRALKSQNLEFIVVHEQFMSPTARFADILLPHTTWFERNDICAWDSEPPFHGFRKKAIEPLYECKSPFEIIRELARRIGIEDDFLNMKEDDYLRRAMKTEGIIPDYDAFKKKGSYKYTGPDQSRIVFKKEIEDPANNPFPTPSGKIEIYSQRLADINNSQIPPIPKYMESWEGRHDPLAAKYPLQLITPHPKLRAHSKFGNVPWLTEIMPQKIMLNAADAEKRGIGDNDPVRVFNDRGEMIVPARVTERIISGVVEIPEGAWFAPDEDGIDRGGCANVLTRDDWSGCGCVPMNTALVQAEKVQRR